ncbi:ribbon-helix-helix domain-containing protein [Devosia sp. MC532]|uniref:ribbon-helix-helix domain-containing protein n=1 Tax=unclassified Devosia TaxID=196773 RepID=UPI0018F69D97|nr:MULTISPECIES: ribbon-helix-helix domain-containing protein [unclassified Devosia]MBJ7577029.1 ribbon-helix-helix domain-containing protein [Devosia sp. MC532]MBK1793740.1 ribbon-helix-helix domain-containing protein [Devosia sp. WQ 349K1]
MDKRSFSIVGHRTSIALEPAFWAGLEAMAQQRGLSLAGLVRHIDETRDTQNLSSAVRLAVLAYYRDGEALARSTDPKAKAE